jgi:predicted dienelactone hydrolase
VRRRRRALATVLVLLAVASVVILKYHYSHPSPPPTSSTTSTTTTSTTTPANFTSAVGTTSLTLTEKATNGLSTRSLVTTVRYPAIGTPGGPDVADAAPLRQKGPYPLIVFSQGFNIQPERYALLLNAWAEAGYVVVDPAYPFTSPNSPGGLVRTDIIHHPADLSFVISSLLDLNAHTGGTLSNLIDPAEVGVIGQSDGGDVSLAAIANTCCRDARIKAAVILSGAELAWFKGSYFTTPAVPMLVVQGTNDLTENPVACSVQLYNEAPQPKYYLSMIGQTHLSAYLAPGAPFQVVVRVTLDFLERYLRHGQTIGNAITAAGTVPGLATITSERTLGPNTGSCPDAPVG